MFTGGRRYKTRTSDGSCVEERVCEAGTTEVCIPLHMIPWRTMMNYGALCRIMVPYEIHDVDHVVIETEPLVQ